MKIHLVKCGNNLAVRLPMEWIWTAGLKEEDELDAQMTPVGEMRLISTQIFDKEDFLRPCDGSEPCAPRYR